MTSPVHMRGATVVLVAIAVIAVACTEDDAGPPDTTPESLRNMAPRTPGEPGPGATTEDVEPNNVLEQASEITWKGEAARTEGVLSGGKSDRDVFLVPPGQSQLVSVRVLPVGADGDLMIGVVSEPGMSPAWFDLRVAGEAETVPNVAVQGQGTWLIVETRGDADVPYQIELEAVGASQATEAEPNDTAATAHSLAVGATTTGYANKSGDVDFLRVPPSDGAPLVLTVTPPSAKAPLHVRLSDDKTEIWQTVTQDGTPAIFRGLRPSPDGYELVVELVGATNRALSYTVAIDQPQGDTPMEFEPNDDMANAQQLEPETRLQASIGKAGDVDAYRVAFEAPPTPPDGAQTPRVLSVVAEPDEKLDVDLSVQLVEAGLQLQRTDALAGEPEAVCNVAVSGANTVEITVTDAEPDAERELPLGYRIRASMRSAEGEELEPNDERARATALTLGAPIKGFISPIGDKDVYRFDVPTIPGDPAARANVDVSAGEDYLIGLAMELYDAQFASVSKRREAFSAVLPAGTYYVVVSSPDRQSTCSRPYSLTVDIDEAYLQRASGADPTGGQGTDPAGGDGPDGPAGGGTGLPPIDGGATDDDSSGLDDGPGLAPPETIDDDGF